ncbi:MAG: hypothetical protein AAGB35_02155 [Pseudomonadota bacterium]
MLDTGNVFDSLPDTISEELFKKILQGENFTLERIVSKGHISPKSGWHEQEESE